MSESSITTWRTRMPDAFGPGPFRLGLRFLGLALFLVWFIGTLWYFDFSPTRLWNGL
ncbi:MAG: phosphonate ABC transporter, permease protein PhnE, partial [Roseomonas sp.]|nr:phosphonate ABC transporter, permease protein PhnE [Roseomonas sp.]